METMGSYFADLAKKGKLNEVNKDNLQEIMQNQAKSLGFENVQVTVFPSEEVEEKKEKE